MTRYIPGSAALKRRRRLREIIEKDEQLKCDYDGTSFDGKLCFTTIQNTSGYFLTCSENTPPLQIPIRSITSINPIVRGENTPPTIKINLDYLQRRN